MPYTADRSPSATPLMPSSVNAICARPTCPILRPASRKAAPRPSWAPTTASTARLAAQARPCCEKILREEWGFDGFVVSDCWAIIDIYAHHKIVDTPEEAAALAVNNGCELNCGTTYPHLLGAVEQGLITEAAIDQALVTVCLPPASLGMFDAPDQVPFAQIPYEIVNSEEHQALALQAARESMVLLKNEGNLLPLSKDIASIAVIGPNADDLQSLLGNYHGTPANYSTPLAGIRKKFSPQTRAFLCAGLCAGQRPAAASRDPGRLPAPG